MSSLLYQNGSAQDELYENSVLAAEISNRMQVPKRIRVGGTGGDEDHGSFRNHQSHDIKSQMKVPDRILVVGQDQHVGMKAPPHELVLENSILSIDNIPPVRVRTPPRSITVDAYDNDNDQEGSDSDDMKEDEERYPQEFAGATSNEIVLIADKSISSEPLQMTMTAPQLTEEVLVLRQQIGRLHRRMAVFEREQQQRQQRDALIISIGAVYLVWKVLIWLTR
nr:EOG090X08OG [Ilyocryptus agilis]